MAKIIDPDQLNQDIEVVLDTDTKKIKLLEAGNLDNNSPGVTSGVAMQALYSFFKNEWMTDASLNKFRFPQTAIYEASFIMTNNWGWEDVSTRNLIRDAGWQEIDSSEYACIISLGSMDDEQADQAYYQQVTGFDQTTENFDKTGPLNEAIQVYGGTDYRGFLKTFLREQGKTYDLYNLLVEQNIAALTYAAYRLPLSNAVDINIFYTDASIAAVQPFTSMQLQYYPGTRFEDVSIAITYEIGDVVKSSDDRWFQCVSTNTGVTDASLTDTDYWKIYPGEKQIGENYYAFNREIRCDVGNPGDRYEMYAWAQHQLRQNSDINDDPDTLVYGTVNGNVANPLCFFVGGNLWGEPGVWFENFSTGDINDLTLQSIDAAPANTNGLNEEDVPKSVTTRIYPFVSTGQLVFNTDLVNDADAKYWMYFENAGGNQFDTTNAIIVNDSDGNPINGNISQQNIDFTFDYDNNNQGGRTPGTDAAVVVVAMGLSDAQWVLGSFNITRTVGLNFPVNAPTERNYISST